MSVQPCVTACFFRTFFVTWMYIPPVAGFWAYNARSNGNSYGIRGVMMSYTSPWKGRVFSPLGEKKSVSEYITTLSSNKFTSTKLCFCVADSQILIDLATFTLLFCQWKSSDSQSISTIIFNQNRTTEVNQCFDFDWELADLVDFY